MKPSTDIAIIDDHEIFAEGLCDLVRKISKSYQPTRFTDAKMLLDVMNSGRKFDLIISDMAMKGMNGLALITALRANDITTPVIITSGIIEDNSLSEENLVKMGASAFVHKTAGIEKFSSTIRTCLRAIYFDTLAINASVVPQSPDEALNKTASEITIPSLGMRQLEVLKLTADGFSNREIAESLTITENTVKSHLQAIFAEFGVKKRTACVKVARELGII